MKELKGKNRNINSLEIHDKAFLSLQAERFQNQALHCLVKTQ
jgi:hypothetical protein